MCSPCVSQNVLMKDYENKYFFLLKTSIIIKFICTEKINYFGNQVFYLFFLTNKHVEMISACVYQNVLMKDYDKSFVLVVVKQQSL